MSKQVLVALVSGLLFAVGLGIAGMTQPQKVIAFLDVTGDWDPSLAFVMGGAILVYMPILRLMKHRGRAVLAPTLQLPTREDLDARLLLGAAMFGIGWGLAGYCPGPALVSLASLTVPALLFGAAMSAGMGLHTLYERSRNT
ncbi:DUF6691 family protein [Paraliomyxa miuraensis]|uniref:DUF6691 family protein n=1 Tax=Paraliomyxa miuraensis TaxID=376150 RepID=UPI00224CED20|nr:DUF6691 family protein [Paraliomyxa miuraensis]MCX4243748.1 YeeE/YedE family protein [Paraliomyxa miuraensis]